MTANQVVDVVGEFRLEVGGKASDRILPIAKLPLLFLKEKLGGPHSENSRYLPEYRGGRKLDTALNLADVIGCQVTFFGDARLRKTEAGTPTAQIQREKRLNFGYLTLRRA